MLFDYFCFAPCCGGSFYFGGGSSCIIANVFFAVDLREAEVHWRSVLESLLKRGLHGIELVFSDGHSGLKPLDERYFLVLHGNIVSFTYNCHRRSKIGGASLSHLRTLQDEIVNFARNLHIRGYEVLGNEPKTCTYTAWVNPASPCGKLHNLPWEVCRGAIKLARLIVILSDAPTEVSRSHSSFNLMKRRAESR
jgi:hypothetical protein